MLISGLGDKVVDAFHKICLSIDGVIYNFINRLYTIFYVLSNNQFFSQEQFNDIASRLYVVIGIIMLFILSYSLLKAIANPDEFAKGENSFPNLIKNIVISIVIIALLPTVFRFAYSVQTTIVQNNVIGNIILPQDKRVDTDNVGIEMAMPIFQAFFHEADGAEVPEYETIIDEIETGSKKFSDIQLSSEIIDAISADQIEYSFPFSTAAGLFVIWVLLLFCIDLGVRVIKLAFYQIIAPIPAICRVLPGSNIKKIWDNWVKVTLATYVEIFTRIAILFLGVYFIIMLKDFDFDIKTNGFLVKALIILGVIAFMRQAPKLLTDIFGFDSSKMGLGLKGLRERLSNTGAYAVGSALVGSQAGIRNMVSTFGNKENWRNDKKQLTAGSVLKNAVRGIGGGIAGTIGGAARAGSTGFSAKSFGDARKGTQEAMTKTTDARNKRWKYNAAHGGGFNAMASHISDVGQKISQFYGFKNPDEVKREMDGITDIQNTGDELKSGLENMVLSAARKGDKNSYGIAGFNTEMLRQLEEAKDAAAQSGNTAASIAAKDRYNKYLKDFVNAITEKSMENDGDFDKYLSSLATQGERTEMQKIRVKADSYKAALSRGLETRYVKRANERAISNHVLEQIEEFSIGAESVSSIVEGRINQRKNEIRQGVIDSLYAQHLQQEFEAASKKVQDDLKGGTITKESAATQIKELAKQRNEALTNTAQRSTYESAYKAQIDAANNVAYHEAIPDEAKERESIKKDIIENLTDDRIKEILHTESAAVSRVMSDKDVKEWIKRNIITYDTLQKGLKTGSGTGAKILGSQMDILLSEDQRIINQMQQEQKTKEEKK